MTTIPQRWTDRRADGRTDGQLALALQYRAPLRFAQSRGKKNSRTPDLGVYFKLSWQRSAFSTSHRIRVPQRVKSVRLVMSLATDQSVVKSRKSSVVDRRTSGLNARVLDTCFASLAVQTRWRSSSKAIKTMTTTTPRAVAETSRD